jgi:hypothetical protein
MSILVILTIIEALLLYQSSLATADLVEGKLAIEFVDYFDKHYVEVSFYLQQHLNTSWQWLKLKPQSGFGILRGLRSGDHIQIAGQFDLQSDKLQFLVKQIQIGTLLTKTRFVSGQLRSEERVC